MMSLRVMFLGSILVLDIRKISRLVSLKNRKSVPEIIVIACITVYVGA